MTGPTLYGIPNCDTVKKARRWLEQHNVNYSFHDFRKDGLTNGLIDGWLQSVSWETLLNRHSRTWRELPETDKQGINQTRAIKLMLANPSLIKRPVLTWNKRVVVGFDTDSYKQLVK